VRIALRSLTTPQQIEALYTGRTDVGFVTASLSHDPILATEPVQRDQLMLAVPRGNPLATRRTVSMNALAAEPFIMVSRRLAPAYHDVIVTWFRDQGFSINATYESDNLFSTMTMVECGLGVALLPASMESSRREVVFKEVNAKTPSLELLVAYRRDYESEVLRSFLAVVREIVAK
jgi:DNA-binding transcriptional LysR family regulator